MKNASSSGAVYSDAGVKSFKLADLKVAASTGRYVFYSAAKDYNRTSTKMIAEGYLNYGFKNVTYLEDPKRGHGNASTEYLNKALDYLDAPLGEIAIARMKSAKKLIRSQPAIAARQFQSVLTHTDAETFADEREKAEKALAKIMDSYASDLEKLQSRIKKANQNSANKLLDKFANKWLQIGVDDVAQMREALELSTD